MTRLHPVSLALLLSLAASTAHASSVQEQAEELAQLRAEVEGLSEQLSAGKDDARGKLRAIEAQKVELEVQVRRQELRLERLLDEEQRQREAARDRAAQTAQTAGGNMDPMEGEEPEFGGGGVANAGSGSVGGGIGGRSGAPPADGAKYPPPADIPSGNDDDVVARQLREAAMREPDPTIREKLWAEYRKYKGIAEPDA